MNMPNNMNFAQYGQRTTGWMGDLVTYASYATVAACAAEGYYIFQHGKDLLAGFGLIHTHHDAISLLKFYGVVGAVAFSLATHKYIKVTAAGLAVMTLAGMYGTQFHLKAEQTFSTASLPTVTSPALNDTAKPSTTAVTPAAVDPSAGEYTTNSTPDELTQWAIDQGYTQIKPLTQAGKDWCAEINPATGKANQHNDAHSIVNCTTGYKWKAPK